ncbi:MAG: hypothetical protein ACRDXB_20865 [Actinomycetes bacterium]
MLKHEEDARKVHEGASDFRAVSTGLRKTIVGWTFHVPRNPGEEYSHDGYSWVDLDGANPAWARGAARIAIHRRARYERSHTAEVHSQLGVCTRGRG